MPNPKTKECPDCGTLIHTTSLRCNPCSHRAGTICVREAGVRYSNCIDCGVKKRRNTSPRCHSCSMEARKEKSGSKLGKYPNCIYCGVEKKGRQTEQPRCKNCINRGKTSKYTKEQYLIKELISTHIRNSIRGKKEGSAYSYLPFTLDELMTHLEAQFTPEMTWENRGSYWQIDHIVPQAILIYDSMEHPNFQKCWSLENLRPLSAEENNRKRAQIVPEAQQLLEKWRCQEQKAQKARRQ